jgi:hypothetical protein
MRRGLFRAISSVCIALVCYHFIKQAGVSDGALNLLIALAVLWSGYWFFIWEDPIAKDLRTFEKEGMSSEEEDWDPDFFVTDAEFERQGRRH